MDIIFKNFILDPFFSILYFPLFWYSKGLVKFLKSLLSTLKEVSPPFVLKILIANLGKPMYGDYSREGRIISFFMRLVHLSFWLLKTFIVFIILFIIFLIYLLLPLLAIYEIICNLNNSCHYFLYRGII